MMSSIKAERTLYLLLDGAKIEGLAKYIALVNLSHVMPLYAGTPLQEASRVSPFLIQVSFSALSYFSELLAKGDNKNGCIVMESDSEFDDVVTYWQSQLFTVFPDTTEPMVFRLYDPRIFSAFQKSDKGIEKSRLFGPCQQIWCWSQEMADWEAFQPQNTVERKEWASVPLILNQMHLDILSDLNLHYLLEQLHQHIQQYFPHLMSQETQRQDFARFIYDRSTEHGFTDRQSIFYFANVWCYLGGSCLDELKYPTIAALLTNVSTKTPQQRVESAALQLADYPVNVKHHVDDYIC